MAATWELKSNDKVKLADLSALLSTFIECLFCARHYAKKNTNIKTPGRLEYSIQGCGWSLLLTNLKFGMAETFTAHQMALCSRIFSSPFVGIWLCSGLQAMSWNDMYQLCIKVWRSGMWPSTSFTPAVVFGRNMLRWLIHKISYCLVSQPSCIRFCRNKD